MSVFPSPSNDSVYDFFSSLCCLLEKPPSYIFTAFSLANIVLLSPLCIYILYHGFQEWWRKRCTSSAVPVAHSDCFTYHVLIMELVAIFGFVCFCIGIHKHQLSFLSAGSIIFIITWQGETLLQVLMCVERYLAVVHPITYLKMKNERGIRMRNISIGCIWLLSFLWIALLMTTPQLFLIMEFFLCCTALALAFFCSLSVLCVLIRPHPGEQGASREKLDQLKQRVLCIIVAILWVLLLRLSWALVHIGVYVFNVNNACLIITNGFWLYLPSSLILPLLFLHRLGKFFCFTGKKLNKIKG